MTAAHAPRRIAWALLLAALGLSASCIPESRTPPPPAREKGGPISLKIVHVAGPRIRGSDPATKKRFEEAIGIASAVDGLGVILFGGDVIANETAVEAADALDGFASLAGIIAARRFVVPGERERSGGLAWDDVLRVFERRGLVPKRSGVYGASVAEKVGVLVLDVGLDGSVSLEARKAAEETLREVHEPVIIVAADRPPLDQELAALLRRDRRVKIEVFRGEKPSVEDAPGEPVMISTPSLDGPAPSLRVIDIKGTVVRVRLIAVPGGALLSDETANLRSDAGTQ